MLGLGYRVGMLTDVRQRRLRELVRTEGSVSVPDLARRLEVSEATIRRDLDSLAGRGLVRRVRGGACDPHSSVPIRPEADRDAFAVVAEQEAGAKRAIGRLAASLVNDGDVIALDIGTTVFAMCDHLRDKQLTVVTASLPVVRALQDAPEVDIVVLGGILRPTYESLVGVLTESCLRQLRVDKAFLGASGVRSDGSVLDSTPSEVPVKRAMIDIATQAWLLADREKFPGKGMLQVASVLSLTGLVTDQPLGSDLLALPDDHTLEVYLP